MADWTYDVVDNEAILTEYVGSDTDIVIPETIDGYDVVGLDNEACRDKNLDSVETHDGILEMGNDCFRDNSLTSFVIPSLVTELSAFIFYGNDITSINIHNNITSISWSAFYQNDLTGISIPDSVTSIGSTAFGYNDITYVSLSENITSISNGVFRNNNIETLDFIDNVEEVGISTFVNNPITEIRIMDDVSYGSDSFGDYHDSFIEIYEQHNGGIYNYSTTEEDWYLYRQIGNEKNIEVFVNGIKVPLMHNSLSIESELNSRDVCSFIVKDLSNQYEIPQHSRVILTNDGKEIFKGFVEISRKRPISYSDNYVHDVQCIDMAYLADKRRISMVELETKAGDIVKQIVDEVLSEEDVYYI